MITDLFRNERLSSISKIVGNLMEYSEVRKYVRGGLPQIDCDLEFELFNMVIKNKFLLTKIRDNTNLTINEFETFLTMVYDLQDNELCDINIDTKALISEIEELLEIELLIDIGEKCEINFKLNFDKALGIKRSLNVDNVYDIVRIAFISSVGEIPMKKFSYRLTNNGYMDKEEFRKELALVIADRRSVLCNNIYTIYNGDNELFKFLTLEIKKDAIKLESSISSVSKESYLENIATLRTRYSSIAPDILKNVVIEGDRFIVTLRKDKNEISS